MFQLSSNRVYDGTGQPAQSGAVQFSGLKNVTLRGWSFRDTLKFTDCESITFDNCEWSGVSGRCLDLFGVLPNFNVLNCRFRNVNGDSCIFCDHGQLIDSSFNDNLFDTVNHGMHFAWGGRKQRNDVKILRNVFLRVYVFCLEMQNGVDGLIIANNYCDKYRPRISRMDFSIATGPMDGVTKALGGTRVEIFNNWFGDPARQGTADAYAAIELMGIGGRVHHNAAKGPRGCLVLSGWDDPNTEVDHNVMSGGTDMAHLVKEEREGVPSAEGKVHDNQFPATLDDPPSPEAVTKGQMWWQTTGPLAPAVAVVDPSAPKISAKARPGITGVVDISLKNTPAGIVQRRPTRGVGSEYVWTDVSRVIDGPCSLADTGQPANWEFDYRLVDDSGKPVVWTTAQVGPEVAPAVEPATQVPNSGPNLKALKQMYAATVLQLKALGDEIARLEDIQ